MSQLSIEQLQAKLAELEMQNQQLLEENRTLSYNEEYGCHTRPGFQKLIWTTIADKAKWLIYFDIDGMRELNELYTHAGVNARIKKSLSVRASDYKTGQRYSGDEFFICVTENPEHAAVDPVEFAMRLLEALQRNGLSATFAIAPVRSDDLMENLEPAVQLVEKAKAHLQRGTISIVPGDPR